MPSHFESIGFSLTPAQTFELIDRIFTSCPKSKTPKGEYVVWRDDGGAEAWLQMDGRNFLGFAPHFRGVSRIRCEITDLVPRPVSKMDSAFRAWIITDAEETPEYPLVFDAPDFHLGPPLFLPLIAEVQIALFPQEFEVFASKDAFEAAQSHRELKLATPSLIPSGLFGEGSPAAEAIATGTVLQTRRLTNSWSGNCFTAIVFATLGGVYDLVLPGEPDHLGVGSIVSGKFWVSGSIIRKTTPPPLKR